MIPCATWLHYVIEKWESWGKQLWGVVTLCRGVCVRERKTMRERKGVCGKGSRDEGWKLNSTKAVHWPYQSVSHPESKCFSTLIYLKSNSFFHRLRLVLWDITCFLYNILQEERLKDIFTRHRSKSSDISGTMISVMRITWTELWNQVVKMEFKCKTLNITEFGWIKLNVRMYTTSHYGLVSGNIKSQNVCMLCVSV